VDRQCFAVPRDRQRRPGCIAGVFAKQVIAGGRCTGGARWKVWSYRSLGGGGQGQMVPSSAAACIGVSKPGPVPRPSRRNSRRSGWGEVGVGQAEAAATSLGSARIHRLKVRAQRRSEAEDQEAVTAGLVAQVASASIPIAEAGPEQAGDLAQSGIGEQPGRGGQHSQRVRSARASRRARISRNDHHGISSAGGEPNAAGTRPGCLLNRRQKRPGCAHGGERSIEQQQRYSSRHWSRTGRTGRNHAGRDLPRSEPGRPAARLPAHRPGSTGRWPGCGVPRAGRNAHRENLGRAGWRGVHCEGGCDPGHPVNLREYPLLAVAAMWGVEHLKQLERSRRARED